MADGTASTTQVRITPDNQGPVIGICTIFLVIVSVISFVGRIFTKTAVIKRLSPDDYVLTAAIVLAVAQSVLVVYAAQNGLGRRAPGPAEDELSVLSKVLYTSGLCFLLCVVLVKISMALLISNAAPVALHKRIALIFSILVAVWGVASAFGAAFVCGANSSWLVQSTCAGKPLIFWNSFDIINLLTDAFLICWPLWMIGSLQIQWKTRIFPVFCFSCRFFVVAGTIVQLVFLDGVASTHGADRAFTIWPFIITIQAVQCLSITTACIPALSRFLLNTESGMLRSDDIRRRGQEGIGYGYDSNASRKNSAVPPASASASFPSRKGSGVVASLLGRRGSQPAVDIPLLPATNPPASDGRTNADVGG